MTRSCYDCKHLRSHQVGYSDETPTGEIIQCVKKLFEQQEWDDGDGPPVDLEQLAARCGGRK